MTDTLPLTVRNTGFLLDRLGGDCHPLQFLRELTQNSIEAILRTPEKEGEIVWDVDWALRESGQQSFKLCITDTGDGMTGGELVKYINQLSSSGVVQSVGGNYGVGAKVSAATRNRAGLVYLSWKHGEGAMIHLWRDPGTGEYGLRQIACPDGSYGHCALIEDTLKPQIIKGRGTKITLWGNSPEEDTMTAPPGVASPSMWIAKYLNMRYFRFPEGVVVKVRQGWEEPRSNMDTNLLRTLEGQERYLEKHKEVSGSIRLTGATTRWWILRDEPALGQNSGHIESAGHVAALHKDELYEMSGGRERYARLQHFGVIFGQRRVVIYIEPVASAGNPVVTNTARTHLLIGGQPLPWADWAAEFRQSMPEEIKTLMDAVAAKSSVADHTKSIRERLKALMDLYKVSRYRPAVAGTLRIGGSQPMTGGYFSPGAASASPREGGPAQSHQSAGDVIGTAYSTFLKKDGQRGDKAFPDIFPKVQWVSVTNGTRESGDMEDRAARYLTDQNRLLINADFRVFTDMIQHWRGQCAKCHEAVGGTSTLITESVHSWFEQALVETIIGLQALRGSKEWNVEQLGGAMSEEALTAVVMQRYHPFNCIKRELGSKIASFN